MPLDQGDSRGPRGATQRWREGLWVLWGPDSRASGLKEPAQRGVQGRLGGGARGQVGGAAGGGPAVWSALLS